MNLITVTWDHWPADRMWCASHCAHPAVTFESVRLRVGETGRSKKKYYYEFQRGATIESSALGFTTLAEAMGRAIDAWRQWARKCAEGAGWRVDEQSEYRSVIREADPTKVLKVGYVLAGVMAEADAADAAELARIELTEDDLAAGFVELKPNPNVNTRGGEIPRSLSRIIKDDLARIRAESDRIEFETEDGPRCLECYVELRWCAVDGKWLCPTPECDRYVIPTSCPSCNRPYEHADYCPLLDTSPAFPSGLV